MAEHPCLHPADRGHHLADQQPCHSRSLSGLHEGLSCVNEGHWFSPQRSREYDATHLSSSHRIPCRPHDRKDFREDRNFEYTEEIDQ